MFNLKKPYSFIESKKEFITYVVNEKYKPIIYNSCPECYKNLLQRCWSQDPEDRPSFEQILFELKTNPDFITEKINKEEFFNYARMIDEYQASFGSSIEPKAIGDIIKKYSVTSKISDFYLSSTFRPDSDEFKKIENYKIIELFKKTNFYTSYLVENKENNMKFIAKSYSFELSNLLRHEIINFCTEVNIIAQLNHPTILKLINYIPINFDNQPKPVVIVENYQETLYHVFKTIKKYVIPKWDDTQKLITMYGIASGMAYLHSHDIIHRDLKPNNIYFDENYYPRISGFHPSRYVSNEKINRLQGTPAYLAPEVHENYEYSKSSDVYSFSLIIYEMMTGEKPYYNLTSPKKIKKCITMKLNKEEEEDDDLKDIMDKAGRPFFNTPIPKAYQKLIERCWSPDPKSRPTFEEIVQEIRTNPEYITDSIDKDEFDECVSFIESEQEKGEILFEPSKKIPNLEEYFQAKIWSFPDFTFNINLNDNYSTELNRINPDNEFIDLRNFEIQSDTVYCTTLHSWFVFIPIIQEKS